MSGRGERKLGLPLMAGNWKMHENTGGHRLVQKLAFTLSNKDFDAVDVAVLPPFTALRSVQTLVDGDRLRIAYGAQDISRTVGRLHGEVSASMLAKLGCDYVLCGTRAAPAPPRGRRPDQRQGQDRAGSRDHAHPLRRRDLEIRQQGQQIEHIVQQVTGGLDGVTTEQVSDMVVAYERSGRSAPVRSHAARRPGGLRRN